MTVRTPSTEGRLLVVMDLDRLAPIVRDCFAPMPIAGVRSYLQAIAEIPRALTRAVLVAHDARCRKPEAALAAIKGVAGPGTPVVYCCEPAYEGVARRLLSHGVDDYVIYPPDAVDLEQTLRIASQQTQRRWVEMPDVVPAPSAEELSRLAHLLPRVAAGEADILDEMASLLCCALNATSATVVVNGQSGRAGRWERRTDDGVLLEPITQAEQRIGQIRLGRSCVGGYTHDDTAKLRHYGVLFGRMLEGGQRAAQWHRLAMTDDLTGLPNRRRLFQFLDEKLRLAETSQSTVTLLIFDIDDFKLYNDTYGHDVGDEILRDIGRLFLQCSRQSDLVSRYGGDEFVVVFWDPQGPRTPGSQHPAGVIEVVQRFREAVKQHTFSRLGPEARGCLTLSGGLAHFPWDARNVEDLIEAADQALLKAKDAGKNRFHLIGKGAVCE